MSNIIEVPVCQFTHDFLRSHYSAEIIEASKIPLIASLLELATDHIPYKKPEVPVVKKDKVLLKISYTKSTRSKIFLKGKIYELGKVLDNHASELAEGMMQHQCIVTQNPHSSAVSLVFNYDLPDKYEARLKKAAQRMREKLIQRLDRIALAYS